MTIYYKACGLVANYGMVLNIVFLMGALAALGATVEVWNNQVLKLDEQRIGLKGSPTWVSKIFSPERAKGEILGDGYADPDGTARMLIEKLLAKDMLPI